MKKIEQIAAVTTGILILGTGCADRSTTGRSTSTEAGIEYFQPDPNTAVNLSGLVRFEGKPPENRRISMDAEQACEELGKDSPAYEDKVLVDPESRGLANALVYIKTGLEGKTFAPATQAIVLDQKGCQFVPRVVSLRAGQTLTVRNSDPVSHNIHPMSSLNREWNQHQAPGADDLQRRFAHPELVIPVKCNVHNWMRSHVAVFDHPYFTVTSPTGAFRIEQVPPGEYKIAVWHESLGERTQIIHLRPGDPLDARALEFTFP